MATTQREFDGWHPAAFDADRAIGIALAAEAAGRDGDVLQLRRLAFLLLFGWLHYILFWWGDILFLFALAGILALFMRELPVRTLVMVALLMSLLGMTTCRPPVVRRVVVARRILMTSPITS